MHVQCFTRVSNVHVQCVTWVSKVHVQCVTRVSNMHVQCVTRVFNMRVQCVNASLQNARLVRYSSLQHACVVRYTCLQHACLVRYTCLEHACSVRRTRFSKMLAPKYLFLFLYLLQSLRRNSYFPHPLHSYHILFSSVISCSSHFVPCHHLLSNTQLTFCLTYSWHSVHKTVTFFTFCLLLVRCFKSKLFTNIAVLNFILCAALSGTNPILIPSRSRPACLSYSVVLLLLLLLLLHNAVISSLLHLLQPPHPSSLPLTTTFNFALSYYPRLLFAAFEVFAAVLLKN
jgi:hypothetical protein